MLKALILLFLSTQSCGIPVHSLVESAFSKAIQTKIHDYSTETYSSSYVSSEEFYKDDTLSNSLEKMILAEIGIESIPLTAKEVNFNSIPIHMIQMANTLRQGFSKWEENLLNYFGGCHEFAHFEGFEMSPYLNVWTDTSITIYGQLLSIGWQ